MIFKRMQINNWMKKEVNTNSLKQEFNKKKVLLKKYQIEV